MVPVLGNDSYLCLLRTWVEITSLAALLPKEIFARATTADATAAVPARMGQKWNLGHYRQARHLAKAQTGVSVPVCAIPALPPRHSGKNDRMHVAQTLLSVLVACGTDTPVCAGEARDRLGLENEASMVRNEACMVRNEASMVRNEASMVQNDGASGSAPEPALSEVEGAQPQRV
jgi:hypothetical protein